MDLDEARRRAARALGDLLPQHDERYRGMRWHDGVDRLELPADEFRVPELIHYGLETLRGLPAWGPDEKLRWCISGVFGGAPFEVSLEKFGLRLRVLHETPEEVRQQLIRRLKTAAKLAEANLRSVALVQIDAGNVTIENRYSQFDGAYRFFREQAEATYRAPPPPPVVMRRDKDGQPTSWSSQPWKGKIDGGYLAGAMVDAYFSRLEHLLVLAAAFADFDPAAGALVRLAGMTWADKFTEVFDVSDAATKTTYDHLTRIKESIRNPAAHGGLGKKGTSFFFHVPSIGALPALLSRRERSFELRITRIPLRTFEQLCEEFDAADSFFRGSRIGAGVIYAEAGLDVAFSADERRKYRIAAQSPETLQDLIERESYLADLHTNMDY